MEDMESKELAILSAKAMDARKGTKITVLKLEDLTVLTDYFVVGTGASRIQTRAMADNIEDELAKAGIRPSRIEGLQEGRWILMDYGHVIIHIFQEDERSFYGLERLWADAPALPFEEVFPGRDPDDMEASAE
ncbi:MAG: ribosome silencing factor [Clostridiales bacterium]|nr:ribosome silencing factor [Clostridiales bacterium]